MCHPYPIHLASRTAESIFVLLPLFFMTLPGMGGDRDLFVWPCHPLCLQLFPSLLPPTNRSEPCCTQLHSGLCLRACSLCPFLPGHPCPFSVPLRPRGARGGEALAWGRQGAEKGPSSSESPQGLGPLPGMQGRVSRPGSPLAWACSCLLVISSRFWSNWGFVTSSDPAAR